MIHTHTGPTLRTTVNNSVKYSILASCRMVGLGALTDSPIPHELLEDHTEIARIQNPELRTGWDKRGNNAPVYT